MSKIVIGVVFGGKSGEHEVSLVSASSIVESIDKEKYDIVEIGITKDGDWLTGENALEKFKSGAFDDLFPFTFSMNHKWRGYYLAGEFRKIDIVFPVLHGPNGEDGTIQGLFEIISMPYVGCGVLASSTAMDKLQCKALWKSAGLPVVPYIGINKKAWERSSKSIKKDIDDNIGYPLFVKPANMGSSVGISKVIEPADLENALNIAFRFDTRVLVEKAVNAREIECAVLGNEDVVASPLGEVIVGGDFYDFYDKYVNGVSTTEVPAKLAPDASDSIKSMCVKAFKVLDGSGLARVDSFIDVDTGKVYLNEINTMPGFTSISMYPKMMKAHGISYPDLIERLIILGFDRFEKRNELQVTFDSGSDWYTQ